MYKIPANTLFLGKNLIFVPECHSTNSLANELSSKASNAEGTLIITSNQTAGRGQRGSTWESEPGKNLTFSIILRPNFLLVGEQFLLNVFTSLAISDLLMALTPPPVHIKWPNDILVDGRKMCGILIENQINGQQVSTSIVGIGLNVNQREFSHATATSIATVTGSNAGLQQVLDSLLSLLEQRYLQLREGHARRLREEYLTRLYWINETHIFRAGSSTFQGRIIGTRDTGRLLVETAEGDRDFDIKEIAYVS